MADKYRNFAALNRKERSGIDFRIDLRRAAPTFAIVAPHGGGIEPGTSELADAIGAADLSFYTLDGLKSTGNSDLHITSTHFDEPLCLNMIKETDVVVSIHGEEGEGELDGVFIGGLNKKLRRRISRALKEAGFVVERHTDPLLQGIEPLNICNRGRLREGVQLEISRNVRSQMFKSLSREGRKTTTPVFKSFVEALRSVLVT
jgi:phage replication-related protein YjqB (UPF0714/DUF867 family)